jgi:hypothetical protein
MAEKLRLGLGSFFILTQRCFPATTSDVDVSQSATVIWGGVFREAK